MSAQLKELLRNKILAIHASLSAQTVERMSKRGLSLFVVAPDVSYAAAILSMGKFNMKDRKEIYDTLISLGDNPCPAYKEKL